MAIIQKYPCQDQQETINFDSRLSLNFYINLTITKAKDARDAHYPVLNKNNKTPLNNRLFIFLIYIKPILLYASSAWVDLISLTKWKRLETIQSIAFRIITGSHNLKSNKTIRQSTGINSLYDETIKSVNVFKHRT